jgi:hypothetical protein
VWFGRNGVIVFVFVFYDLAFHWHGAGTLLEEKCCWKRT